MAQRKFPDWATTFIVDVGDTSPNIIEPDASKQETGWLIEKPTLQTMNWLQNLFGHFIRANNEFKVEADSYEAEAGEIVNMDNSLGAVTGFLPASPLDGQWVAFGGVLPYSTNLVNINGNGNDIMVGGTTDVDLDVDNRIFVFNWDETNNFWKINLGLLKGAV